MLTVDRGAGAYAGPRLTNVGEKRTKANGTIQIRAKPASPVPPPRSGFVQQCAAANAVSGLSSAFAVHITRPAWLSSGR